MPKHILVVDDEPNVRHGLQRILHPMRHAWDVTLAENGREALALLRCFPFDLVLTDILMPEQEGLETIREIRRAFPAVKIIAISGGGQQGNLNFLGIAERLGALRTLRKPFSPQALLAAIHEVFQNDAAALPDEVTFGQSGNPGL